MTKFLHPFLLIPGCVLALTFFVLKAEYKDWGRRLSKSLVAVASSVLSEPEKSRRREEWEAEIFTVWTDTSGECTGLAFATYLAVRYVFAAAPRHLSTFLFRKSSIATGASVIAPTATFFAVLVNYHNVPLAVASAAVSGLTVLLIVSVIATIYQRSRHRWLVLMAIKNGPDTSP